MSPLLLLLISLIALFISGLWLFLHFYRRHIQGENAPQRQAFVTILDKQIIDIPHPLPDQEDQEYWIYVQKGLGPKREFQVGPHYFHALNPGDQGELTYQGRKFLHFALTR
ncbi:MULTISPECIES: DUF2500 domain-containing protein [unclassified Vibrio]|uniref:DUF2500 domain-containing protein n=1 Tax=unclassified Vibrio TaxID=2614977 RepID=UPI0014835D22|nr:MULTISPECIES: DUF2500 domain-containing protein [unclassified Vibrio]NNN46020.1 DUF2500 domain-containing protein [Vibrio sp. 1-1(7)]NNN73914.1 DUF2500 domain-containing protein [Vibrio sp. 12-2(3-a)]